mgnify:FL=1
MNNEQTCKRMRKRLKALIIRDADKLAAIVALAAVVYEVEDIAKLWTKILHSKHLDSTIQEVAATRESTKRKEK